MGNEGSKGWYDRSRRAYPSEFRQQLVELFRAGRSTSELAKEFGPHPQSIRNWAACAKDDAGKAGKGTLSASDREELDRLRRENRQLRLEREILSKAAAWFARETSGIPPKDSGS
jgi:transposase